MTDRMNTPFEYRPPEDTPGEQDALGDIYDDAAPPEEDGYYLENSERGAQPEVGELESAQFSDAYDQAEAAEAYVSPEELTATFLDDDVALYADVKRVFGVLNDSLDDDARSALDTFSRRHATHPQQWWNTQEQIEALLTADDAVIAPDIKMQLADLRRAIMDHKADQERVGAAWYGAFKSAQQEVVSRVDWQTVITDDEYAKQEVISVLKYLIPRDISPLRFTVYRSGTAKLGEFLNSVDERAGLLPEGTAHHVPEDWHANPALQEETTQWVRATNEAARYMVSDRANAMVSGPSSQLLRRCLPYIKAVEYGNQSALMDTTLRPVAYALERSITAVTRGVDREDAAWIARFRDGVPPVPTVHNAELLQAVYGAGDPHEWLARISVPEGAFNNHPFSAVTFYESDPTNGNKEAWYRPSDNSVHYVIGTPEAPIPEGRMPGYKAHEEAHGAHNCTLPLSFLREWATTPPDPLLRSDPAIGKYLRVLETSTSHEDVTFASKQVLAYCVQRYYYPTRTTPLGLFATPQFQLINRYVGRYGIDVLDDDSIRFTTRPTT